MSELIAMTATEVVGLLRAGEVSSLELLDALERRIAAVDGAVGALPTLCMDRARDHAKALEAQPTYIGTRCPNVKHSGAGDPGTRRTYSY
jgi:Asp-tRNA(Asn)/Glu-tRNA(Gln) amidotransferase A subunit family amidase